MVFDGSIRVADRAPQLSCELRECSPHAGRQAERTLKVFAQRLQVRVGGRGRARPVGDLRQHGTSARYLGATPYRFGCAQRFFGARFGELDTPRR
jgi:hypothetical protein